MELEELKSKFQAAMGSTQLQLSEQTLDGFYGDVLGGITDDAQVTDEFINGKLGFLKILNGQLHRDVGLQVEEYKKNYKPAPPTQEPKPEEPKPKNGDELIASLQARIEAMEKARKDESEKAALAARVAEARKGVENALKEKFRKAGVEANTYFLKQSMRDIDFSGDDGTDKLADVAEKAYYAALKEAGVQAGAAPSRSGGGGGGSKPLDDYFAKKRQREGWGQKK